MKVTVVMSRKEYDTMLRVTGCASTKPEKNKMYESSVYDGAYIHKEKFSINEYFFMDFLDIIARHKKQVGAIIESFKALGGLFSDLKGEFRILRAKWN